MTNLQNIPRVHIKSGGADLTSNEIADLIELTVDQSIGAPDAIMMRFRDTNLKLADSTKFNLGTEIEVKMAGPGERAPQVVTKGEVYSVEPNFVAGGESETVVLAFHKFNRMHHGRKTRTFLDSKDSDAVTAIAGDLGLSTSIDVTDTVYPYLVQWNQTDMEFLRERAQRIGYLAYTDATTLYFKKWDIATSPVVTLIPSANLSAFRPRLTLAQQVVDVKVRKWDVQTKAAIEGVAAAPNDAKQGGASTTGSGAVSTAYGASVLTIVDPSVKDAADAQVIANGYIAQRTREYTEAEADCYGDPALRPGTVVKVENVGTRFSGNYMVTSARHAYNGISGYMTSITMTGGNPMRIGDMLGAETRPQRIPGVMPAIVTNLADPENKGRIKVSFKQMPQHQGVDLESGWIRMSTPMTGAQRGFQFYPEVGDEVLVAFEGGDPNAGIIIGGLWNGSDASPMAASEFLNQSQVKMRKFKSMAGHEIIFGEDDGSDLSVTIKDVKGNKILLDAKNEKITITAMKDMLIDVTGDLEIKATGAINVSTQKSMEMKATQNITLNAAQNLELKATQNATMKATMNATVEGTAGAAVKSTAKLELSGTAMAELKGALVKIN